MRGVSDVSSEYNDEFLKSADPIGCEMGWPRTEIGLGRGFSELDEPVRACPVEMKERGDALVFRLLVRDSLMEEGYSSAGVGARG